MLAPSTCLPLHTDRWHLLKHLCIFGIESRYVWSFVLNTLWGRLEGLENTYFRRFCGTPNYKVCTYNCFPSNITICSKYFHRSSQYINSIYWYVIAPEYYNITDAKVEYLLLNRDDWAILTKFATEIGTIAKRTCVCTVKLLSSTVVWLKKTLYSILPKM